jgi:hypothetical protein
MGIGDHAISYLATHNLLIKIHHDNIRQQKYLKIHQHAICKTAASHMTPACDLKDNIISQDTSM